MAASKVHFEVKDHQPDQPFLDITPAGGDYLVALDGFMLALQLKHGTSLDDARDLASKLNALVYELVETPNRG